MTIAYLLPLTVGFLGSLHCLGMCGPLVIAYSLDGNPGELLPGYGVGPLRNGLCHHLAFHAGRLLTYGFLGGLAAGLFGLTDFSDFFSGLRRGMAIAGGLIMVAIGLTLLRLIPVPGFLGSDRFLPRRIRERVLPALFKSQHLAAKTALGLFAGFLPCGLSWAMIVKAATAQSIPEGFFTMLSFGLGTVPALLAAGLFTSFLSLELRLLGERLAAFAVLFMGIFMIASGVRLHV